MAELEVQIVQFVDNHQPGFVRCQFVDAAGHCHLIVEKAPVVTTEDLDAASEYPKSGSVRCEILRRYRNEKGQELVRISTQRPFSVESTEGVFEFTVPAALITASDN
jgi:hypothetical protein